MNYDQLLADRIAKVLKGNDLPPINQSGFEATVDRLWQVPCF